MMFEKIRATWKAMSISDMTEEQMNEVCQVCGFTRGDHYGLDGDACPIGEVLRGPHPTLKFAGERQEGK
jgi:hypothetical protein